MDLSVASVDFTRIYLACFFTGVAIFYTVRISLKKKEEPIQFIHPGKQFCTTWFNHMIFRFFRVAIWMVCLIRWPFPQLDGYIGIVPQLSLWPIVLVGDALLAAGFALAIAGHFDLGAQWRSGIDPSGPTHLKTNGLYRVSRNPMYLGVAIAQLGFFMALPSLFSLLCLSVGLYTLHSQSQAEEAHLENTFHDLYLDYKLQVRRWI